MDKPKDDKDNEVKLGELTKIIGEQVKEAMKEIKAPDPADDPAKKAEDAKLAEEAKDADLVKKAVDEILKKIPAEGFKGFPAIIKEQGDKRHFGEVLRAVKFGDQRLLKKYNMVPSDEKVIVEGTTTSGGYLVPVEYDTQIMRIVEDESVLRPLCTKVPMKYLIKNKPVVTSGIAAYWIDENSEKTLADWTLGQLQLTAYKLCCLTSVSNEELEDSDPSAEKELMKEFAISIANKEDLAFLYGAGSGASDPITGIYNLSSVVTQAVGATFDFDDFFSAIGQVKGNRAKKVDIIINPIIEGILRKLKGSDGQYVWANATGATPKAVGGYPVHDDYNIPTNINTNETTVIGGDFRNAVIGDKGRIVIAQGLNDTDFQYDRTTFRAVKRVGFKVHSSFENRFFRITGVPTS